MTKSRSPRKRPSQWHLPGAEEKLNPLGRRILATMLLRDWGPAEFRAAAGLPARTAVDSLLDRLKPDVETTNVAMDTIVRLARAGRVSLVWLATGEGDMLAGAYADSDDLTMEGMPEELVRATRAAMVMTGCTHGQALKASHLAWARPRTRERSVDDWLTLVRAFIEMDTGESGERPSVRALRLNDDPTGT